MIEPHTFASTFDRTEILEEWKCTPTDLGGWANRAHRMLDLAARFEGERDRAVAALEQIEDAVRKARDDE